MTFGVVFAGNRLSAFTCTANVGENSLGGSWDGNYAGNSLGYSNAAGTGENYQAVHIDPATGAVASLTGAFGIHYEMYYNTQNDWVGGVVVWQMENSSGQGILRAINVNGNTSPNTAKVQYWNGSSWIDTGITWGHFTGNRLTMDFIGTLGASGSIQLFINGTLTASGSIASAAASGGTWTRFFPPGSNSNFRMGYSQILIKDGSTLNRKVGRRPPTATGNYTQFTGTTVGNVTDNNDGTFMTDNANGNKSSFTLSVLTVTPASYNQIEAVVVSARINHDTSGTQNAKFFLREGGVDYALGYNMPAFGIGFDGRIGIFTQDPATSAAWAIAAANGAGLEAGIQDVT